MSFDEEYDEPDGLFEEISSHLRTPEQVARWFEMGEAPTYKLLRDPINLKELNSFGCEIVMWRDNGTLTYFAPHGIDDSPNGISYLSLIFYGGGPTFHIVGKTDDAMAETAAVIMGWQDHTDHTYSLCVKTVNNSEFDFSAAGSQCLTRLFEFKPSREMIFEQMTMSVEQSIVLATESQRAYLTLYGVMFKDRGSAFVDALEHRKSPFRSLSIELNSELSDDTLRRLLKLDSIDHLRLPILDNDDLALPFSAKMDSLDCCLLISSLDVDLNSLNITASKLGLNLDLDECEAFPTEPVLALFSRLVDLGHFVKLKVKFVCDYGDIEIPECVAHELIRVAQANKNLEVLDLCTDYDDLKWDSHFLTLFDGLKDHPTLNTLNITVDDEEEAFGPDYIHLHKLLSHNRRLGVEDNEGYAYTDGPRIDELYKLNFFYVCSADLLTEPSSVRSLLLATALMAKASNGFQCTDLLLRHHTDALCELVQFARLADELDDDAGDGSTSNHQDQKRVRRM